MYVRGYVYVLAVCNWRIKISHKRHAFICHVKIHALSTIYANLISLIHASRQSACKQIHRFAAVNRGACCNPKMLSRSYLIYLTKTFGSINKIFGRVNFTFFYISYPMVFDPTSAGPHRVPRL